MIRMALRNKIGNLLKEASPKLPSLQSSISNASFYQANRYFSSKLFIGGLSFATDENSLREAFLPYGDIVEARIIFDRESGRSRGFGFVAYASAEEASAAIQALDGRDLHGRFLRVAYAADQKHTSRGPSFSGAAAFSGSFGGNHGYESATSHTGGNFSGGESNYGHENSYGSYGNIGYGKTRGYNDSNSSSPNVGKFEGLSGCRNGAPTYTGGDDMNAAGGHCLLDAGDDFGGNTMGGGYGGGSSENVTYGATGNFSSCNYSSYNADGYNATHDGVNSFNDRTSYNSMRQGNDDWLGHNVECRHRQGNDNLNDQDEKW